MIKEAVGYLSQEIWVRGIIGDLGGYQSPGHGGVHPGSSYRVGGEKKAVVMED